MRIIYIDVDSLRADHLGCYGYHRNTSPNIDAIARRGVRFSDCWASDAPCLPSRTALYSGRFGIHTGVVGHCGTASQPKIDPARGFRDTFVEQGLARQLQKKSMHTAMISPFGQRHAAHWFYAGFNEIHNTGMNGMESAEHVMPVVTRWLRDHAAGDNWFLHVNFWDPHTPYRAPLSYGNPFKDEPLPAWLNSMDVIRRHMRMTGPHTALDPNMYDEQPNSRYPRWPGKVTDLDSLRRVIDGYDTAVRYMDDAVGSILALLKETGVGDETAIIISADHGENLGELGIYHEHATADRATCQVPLIVQWPGFAGGHVDSGLHYSLDLAPTLADLLEFKPCPVWDGQSFAPAILRHASAGRSDLVVSQCAHVCQRSVRWDRWLYMRTYHDGFHLFPDEMLFDLQADPFQQHDLASEHVDICRQGAWRLADWHTRQMQKMAAGPSNVVDPLWTVIHEGGPCHAEHKGPESPLRAYLQRLEATGRADGAAALRARYAAFL